MDVVPHQHHHQYIVDIYMEYICRYCGTIANHTTLCPLALRTAKIQPHGRRCYGNVCESHKKHTRSLGGLVFLLYKIYNTIYNTCDAFVVHFARLDFRQTHTRAHKHTVNEGNIWQEM